MRDFVPAGGLERSFNLESLIAPGSSSTPSQTHPWPLLPLVVCESVSRHFERALPAAAALSLFRASAEIFDDVEDADSSTSLSAQYGPAVAVNIATGLLVLAEKALTRLRDKGVKDGTTVDLIGAINTYLSFACAGQHEELSLTGPGNISEDRYLEITYKKSASFIECACNVGAVLGGADAGLVNKFSLFGRNLGMASQIANDIQGIIRGSDILKHKTTLPFIFAASQADDETQKKLGDSYNLHFNSVNDTFQTRDLLFRCGAMYYTTVRMEMFKQQASDILAEVKNMAIETTGLNLFL